MIDYVKIELPTISIGLFSPFGGMKRVRRMGKNITPIDATPPLPRPEKVGIYCRVSSPTAAQIHSLSAQASYLLKFALHHRGWIVTDIYIDISSGSTVEKRPEFMRMLTDIRLGRLTQIVTKSVSRFGRNSEEILEAYRAIKELGAEIYFDEQDLDSRLPDSELYVSLYGGLAQAENTQLSENMKWAIKKRAADGTSAIYNRPCYGYRVNEEGVFDIVPEEASVVREIFSLYISGLSILKIKRHLEGKGVLSPSGKSNWSKHTIEVILANKKYVGASVIYKTYQDGYPKSKRITNRGTHDIYVLNDHHIPIVPEEIFEQAQRLREERTNIELDEEGKLRRKAKKYSSAKTERGQE